MENGKFKVTSNKVDDLVIRLSKDYPDINIADIKCFFGSGCGDSWQFEEDWFPDEIDYDELSDSFATWVYNEYEY